MGLEATFFWGNKTLIGLESLHSHTEEWLPQRLLFVKIRLVLLLIHVYIHIYKQNKNLPSFAVWNSSPPLLLVQIVYNYPINLLQRLRGSPHPWRAQCLRRNFRCCSVYRDAVLHAQLLSNLQLVLGFKKNIEWVPTAALGDYRSCICRCALCYFYCWLLFKLTGRKLIGRIIWGRLRRMWNSEAKAPEILNVTRYPSSTRLQNENGVSQLLILLKRVAH